MGRAPTGVDILTVIPGIEFDSAWSRRLERAFDEETSERANFISRRDLLASKRAAGQPQDLADIDAIERAGRTGRISNPLLTCLRA